MCCRIFRRSPISCPATKRGLAASKGTPAEIVDRLNKAVNEILADPKAKARFTEIGAILLPGSAADFGKLVAEETEKWGKVVRFAGAKVD
jgi:tripartite-type tricarboxylate transporter receptor subunit TctC